MRKIFRKYPELTLAVLAAFFIAVLFAAFSWGIGNVIISFSDALNANAPPSGNVGFNLQGAKALDLHGLVNQGQ